jgi:hypothetical protein
MIRPIPLAFAAVVFSSALFAQDSRPEGGVAWPSDRVVAKVNRTVITQSDIDRELGVSGKAFVGKHLESEQRKAVVRLVVATVERDAVEKLGLSIPKRFVEERLEEEKEEASKRGDSFQSMLAEQASTEEEFRDDLQAKLQRQTYLAAATGNIRAQQFRPDYWPDPTVEDVRNYYRRRLAEFTLKNRARVFAIALPYQQYPSDEGKPVDDRAKQVAEQIRGALATGADFATLARRYSRSAEFKPEQGGDLGWIEEEKSPLNPMIVTFAFKGPVRELSPNILYPRAESPRSILLLWVDERVDERVIPFEEAQTDIREGIRRLRLQSAQFRIQAKLLEDAYIWPPELKQELLGGVR